MNYKYRDKCLITENKDLEHLSTIKKLPVFIGCTNQPEEEDIKEDMEVYISKSSGIIQLRKLLPLDLVYSHYHSEAVGDLWDKHFYEFSNFILKHNKSKEILEIGGSNGKLAEQCVDLDKNLKWTIIEPNPSKKKFKEKNINIIKSFIEDKLELISNGATIVHSHTLEHLYDPLAFFKSITEKSRSGDIMIFSIPHLHKYLEKKFVNTLNFEHTYFITEDVADYLIKKMKYELIDKQFFNEHSIFYAIRFKGKGKLKYENININKYYEYKEMYLNFINFIDEEVLKINKSISEFMSHNNNLKIYLFGAHIFSQFLINRGLHADKIFAIIDNSPNKIGKRLYGSSLHVINPNKLMNSSGIVIVKAGQYQTEVVNQLKKISDYLKFIF